MNIEQRPLFQFRWKISVCNTFRRQYFTARCMACEVRARVSNETLCNRLISPLAYIFSPLFIEMNSYMHFKAYNIKRWTRFCFWNSQCIAEQILYWKSFQYFSSFLYSQMHLGLLVFDSIILDVPTVSVKCFMKHLELSSVSIFQYMRIFRRKLNNSV